MYRSGIIGCGEIAQLHAKAYAFMRDTQLVAVSDVVPEAAVALAREYPGVTPYQNHQDMLEKETLDVVSVCTWPQVRPMIVADVCRHSGVRLIYAEKPMAISLREADSMVEAARQAGVLLVVGHQRRYGGRWKQAKAMLQEGVIGQLLRIEAACDGWDAFQWGTHWIDIMRFFNDDQPVDWVLAQVDRRWDRIAFGHRLETECIAQVGFYNGVRGLLETGDRIAGDGFYNRLIGTEGMIEVNGVTHPLRAFTRTGSILPEAPTSGPHFPSDVCRAISSALRAVESGSLQHPLDGASARITTEIVMAIYESARIGRLVELPLQQKESPLRLMLEHVGVPLVVKP